MKPPLSDPHKPDAPGWYPDPWSATGTGERYFDGKAWGTTERPRGFHTTDAQVVTIGIKRRQRRSRRARARLTAARPAVAVVVIVVLAVAYWMVQSPSREASSNSGVGVVRPPVGAQEASHRLAPPPLPVPASGNFQFQRHQPGEPTTPVAFDPCRPIHYVVNPQHAPNDGLAAVLHAVSTVEQATGLKFVYDGTTTEAPVTDRAAYQPKRYDEARWAPVLIAWSDEATFPTLAGDVAGSTSLLGITQSDGRSVYVSGLVVLDSTDLSELESADRSKVRATALHELGHLVGLDHTTDRAQLMYPELQPGMVGYGLGDLLGLAIEGSQPCFPDV